MTCMWGSSFYPLNFTWSCEKAFIRGISLEQYWVQFYKSVFILHFWKESASEPLTDQQWLHVHPGHLLPINNRAQSDLHCNILPSHLTVLYTACHKVGKAVPEWMPEFLPE